MQRIHWHLCCAPECTVVIDPGDLACPEHWQALSEGARRHWIEAWRNWVIGVPSTLPEPVRRQHLLRLKARLRLQRRRAYQFLAEAKPQAPQPEPEPEPAKPKRKHPGPATLPERDERGRFIAKAG